jgi:flagellar protein FliS
MLIDAALRFAAKAKEQWRAGANVAASDSILRCQEIVTQILGGIRPDADRAIAGKISAIYGFVFRSLVTAHLRSDAAKLDEAVSVLQVERETWQQLCTRLAEAPPPVAVESPVVGAGFSLHA